jgi:hypothetical protein
VGLKKNQLIFFGYFLRLDSPEFKLGNVSKERRNPKKRRDYFGCQSEPGFIQGALCMLFHFILLLPCTVGSVIPILQVWKLRLSKAQPIPGDLSSWTQA